jgi:hypothetical protein
MTASNCAALTRRRGGFSASPGYFPPGDLVEVDDHLLDADMWHLSRDLRALHAVVLLLVLRRFAGWADVAAWSQATRPIELKENHCPLT